eukprot:TRINITY_DN307_c0_g1_i4.p1 TRINITY_DN307_c0_g1~~TRINITY_DN307_c0_g1_i4.p1  ORF type:complete len:223 (-),score=63.41 TRINITY_DN307_c0_g1_i4:253-921(-)
MMSTRQRTFEEAGSRKLQRRSRSLAAALLAAVGVMAFAIEAPQCFFGPSIQVPSRVPSATANSRDSSAIAMAAVKFDGMKAAELKSLCTEQGLPVGGSKADLIARLKAPKATLKALEAKKKVQKVSVVATGRLAKVMVFKGSKAKTVGGLTKDKLVKNKEGRIVSKAQYERGKKIYKKNGLAKWVAAVQKARKALKITGFVAIGGKSKEGKQLYEKAKSFYA